MPWVVVLVNPRRQKNAEGHPTTQPSYNPQLNSSAAEERWRDKIGEADPATISALR
jgi:hypothetical protein